VSSTFDYNKIQDTALSLIEKFGATATIKRPATTAGAGAWNVSSQVSVTEIGKAVRTEYGLYNIDGSAIKVGDIKLLLAAKDLALIPTQGDILTFASIDYQVINIDPLAPADVIVVYKVQLRR
jgi:hypothetical protein